MNIVHVERLGDLLLKTYLKQIRLRPITEMKDSSGIKEEPYQSTEIKELKEQVRNVHLQER